MRTCLQHGRRRQCWHALVQPHVDGPAHPWPLDVSRKGNVARRSRHMQMTREQDGTRQPASRAAHAGPGAHLHEVHARAQGMGANDSRVALVHHGLEVTAQAREHVVGHVARERVVGPCCPRASTPDRQHQPFLHSHCSPGRR